MYLPSPTVLLFDIDGTLIDADGAGRRSLERAFEQVVGDSHCLAFPFAGMTDPAIIREGLRRANGALQDDRERAYEAIVAAYLGALPEEVLQAPRYQVCPGVVPLLQEAATRAHIAVGLGTGNMRRGAEIKLERAGLAHFFRFGGFGCDHVDRPSLLRIAARRGAKLLDVPLDSCRVVVIGDTPLDVSAALAIDAECVAVGTGESSPEQLLACGATAAFVDLRHEGAEAAVLG